MQSTAREVAQAVFEALARRDYRSLSAMIDTEAATTFRTQQAEWLQQEEYLQSDEFLSAIPEEERGQWAGPRVSMLRALYAVDSLEEFAALSPREVLERFLRIRHGERASSGDAPERTTEIVGEAHDGDDLVHIVFRRPPISLQRTTWDSVDVLSLRRRSEGWACALNGGLVYGCGGDFAIGIGYPDDPPELIDPS